jgi:phage tail sheath protein FI
VGTSVAISDDLLADLYSPQPGGNGFARPAINVLRTASGAGVELWGARTTCTERWLRFLAVRRGLSAVQRRCYAALQRTVFEPNTPALWMQVTQIVLNELMSLFHSGALRGNSPDESFYVRCDNSVNPPESIALGRLIVEVGVAIAAPAEFIVFRLGRSEGIVEVLE